MQELAGEAIKYKHRQLIAPQHGPRSRGTLSSMTDPIVIFVRECSVAVRQAIAREPQQAPRLVFLKEYVPAARQLRLHGSVLLEPSTPVEALLSESFGSGAEGGEAQRFLAWAEVRAAPRFPPLFASVRWLPFVPSVRPVPVLSFCGCRSHLQGHASPVAVAMHAWW